MSEKKQLSYARLKRKVKRKPKRGRPRNPDRPAINWPEIEELIVYGEIRVEEGKLVLVWPSIRELSERMQISRAAIGQYSSKNGCQKKKQEAIDRFTDEELFDLARECGRIWAPSLTELPDCLVKQPDGSFAPIGYLPAIKKTPGDLVGINELPREEIARLLVHGEPVVENEIATRRYPSQSELAKRYGTYRQAIRRIWEEENCDQRREDARLIYHRNLDQNIVDLHVNAEVDHTQRQIDVIDRWVERFEANVDNLRVDNVADFDRLVRLRMLLSGGVESRTETRSTVVTLEAVQAAHQKFLEAQTKVETKALPAELTGEVIDVNTEKESEEEERAS